MELDEHYKIGFYTATILEWKKLLMPDQYKDIIVNSLRFAVEEKRAKVYGFVIMPNHLHLLWKNWRAMAVKRRSAGLYEIYRANDQT